MRYRLLAYLFLAALIAYIQRAAISVPLKEIGIDLGLATDESAKKLGMLQSAWYLGYAILQVPGGRLASRIGGRAGILLFMFFASMATGLTGAMPGYTSLLIVWTLMGAMQAGIFPCAVKLIGQTFAGHERARASGWLGCGMMTGGAIGPALTGWLLKDFGPHAEALNIDPWRMCLVLFAIPGILWVVIFWLNSRSMGLDDHITPTTRGEPIDWGRVFTSVPLILLCSQQFLRAASMVFFLTWFPTFLRETRGVSQLEAGKLTTYAGLAGILGSVLGGYFSDWMLGKTGNRRLSRQGIATVGMSSCAAFITMSYFVDNVTAAITLIGIGVFCAAFGGVSGYTVAIEFGGKHMAVVFGAMNMCGSLGSMLFPWTVGDLVARTKDWNMALFTFVALMAVDAVCWGLLNPKGTFMGDEDDKLGLPKA